VVELAGAEGEVAVGEEVARQRRPARADLAGQGSEGGEGGLGRIRRVRNRAPNMSESMV
jgi:hypothetical protein